jgi:hypothetical protein
MGMACVALIRRAMLMVRARTKPAYQRIISVPVASLAFPRQNAKVTSKSPAMINMIQFICFISLFNQVFPVNEFQPGNHRGLSGKHHKDRYFTPFAAFLSS